MISTINCSIQKAKKSYHDDAYEFIREHIDNQFYGNKGTPFRILRLLVKIKADHKWVRTIQPGQKYERQYNRDGGGETWTFRSKIEFIELAKYGFDLSGDL